MAKRACADCGADLSGFPPAARRCIQCCERIMRDAGLEPLVPYPGAHKGWKCRCMRCGEEGEPRLVNVQRLGRGCNTCGRRAGAAARRLPEDRAVAAMLATNLEPLDPYPGSQEPWRCRCLRCDAEVYPLYNNIANGWGGCGDCGIAKRADACRTPEAEAAAALHQVGLEPLESYRNNSTPWHSRCVAQGHEVWPTLHNIQTGHCGGCAFCAGKAVDADEACRIMRAAGLVPLVPYPGANDPWPCQCDRCGRPVNPRYNAVRTGTGCRYCSNGSPTADEAAAFVVNRGLEPLEPYPDNVKKPWRCKCTRCGRPTSPCFNDIKRSVRGCQWCRNRGFKAYGKAAVYLIIHEGYDAAKIGIMDDSHARLKKHHGWQKVLVIAVPGEVARAVETAILDWWHIDLGLPIHLGRNEMRQGGWTETVAASEIDLAVTMAQMRAFAAFLSAEPGVGLTA
jgi:hypothetical protein